MATPELVFFDGKIVPYHEAKVGVLTHGLNYGTGIFGGMRGYWNEEKKQMFVFRRSTITNGFSIPASC